MEQLYLQQNRKTLTQRRKHSHNDKNTLTAYNGWALTRLMHEKQLSLNTVGFELSENIEISIQVTENNENTKSQITDFIFKDVFTHLRSPLNLSVQIALQDEKIVTLENGITDIKSRMSDQKSYSKKMLKFPRTFLLTHYPIHYPGTCPISSRSIFVNQWNLTV